MESSNVEIWRPCLEFCESRVKQQSFYTWLKPTSLLALSGDEAVIGVPNRFVLDWVRDHYMSLLGDALAHVTGRQWRQRLEIRPNLTPVPTNGNGNGNGHGGERARAAAPAVSQAHSLTAPARRQGSEARATASLNPKYTFGSFVVGDSNQLAHAAAKAVADNPGKTRFNPMCIYGSVGIGKTHLAQAIGNALLESNPGARVLYVTSEQFTNDFISSLANNTTSEFTERYRSVDVLLIDDIQFFAGKESTQVQFFHTFNTLHQNGKQIVLTADRMPKDIRGVEERLLSRFQWGLTTDIGPPDFETRIAILRKKMEGEEAELPDEALSYIARAGSANVRELEGALIKLLAYSSLKGVKITLEVAQQVLRDSLSTQRRPITISLIISKVSESFGIPVNQVTSKRRTQEVVLTRQVAMYLARTLTSTSLKAIGEEFGGRDHSTVIHSVSLIRGAMQADSDLRARIEQVIASLYAGATAGA
ncbi:MAG: chromosomal replication initiator protein DnaA [Candidatus Zixiibacteriota bacterium]